MGTCHRLRAMTSDHKRKNKSLSFNIVLNLNSPSTIIRARFLANSHNKTQIILLLLDVLGRNGVEVLLAEDDVDTLIAKTALRYGLARAFGKSSSKTN